MLLYTQFFKVSCSPNGKSCIANELQSLTKKSFFAQIANGPFDAIMVHLQRANAF